MNAEVSVKLVYYLRGPPCNRLVYNVDSIFDMDELDHNVVSLEDTNK